MLSETGDPSPKFFRNWRSGQRRHLWCVRSGFDSPRAPDSRFQPRFARLRDKTSAWLAVLGDFTLRGWFESFRWARFRWIQNRLRNLKCPSENPRNKHLLFFRNWPKPNSTIVIRYSPRKSAKPARIKAYRLLGWRQRGFSCEPERRLTTARGEWPFIGRRGPSR